MTYTPIHVWVNSANDTKDWYAHVQWWPSHPPYVLPSLIACMNYIPRHARGLGHSGFYWLPWIYRYPGFSFPIPAAMTTCLCKQQPLFVLLLKVLPAHVVYMGCFSIVCLFTTLFHICNQHAHVGLPLHMYMYVRFAILDCRDLEHMMAFF